MELEHIVEMVKKQKKAPVASIKQRMERLNALKSLLVEHEQAWINALQMDLGKPWMEAYTSEIAVLLNEIDRVIKQLPKWAKPTCSRYVKLGYIETVRKKREPFGCVLIISPWNYPLQLSLMPAINAIAAGNSCIIKPSEHAPATSRLLESLINQSFDPKVMVVINGGVELSRQLTAMNVDLIFFTGSGESGKSVLRQAADQLTPVVLELGGKNPCIMDETGFSKSFIQSLIWGKFLNAGQTCIAPDMLFVHESIYEQVLQEISVVLKAFYGEDAYQSKDYGRICHAGHFHRVKDFLSQGKVWYGGSSKEQDLYIEPTVLIDLEPDSAIWEAEIFGPILPVVPYNDFETLLQENWIEPDALVAYLFSNDKQHRERLQKHMRSTVLSVNQVILHSLNPAIAFGGIGKSGHGTYHMKAGFDSFSYEKAIYDVKHMFHIRSKLPPYDRNHRSLLRRWRRWLL